MRIKSDSIKTETVIYKTNAQHIPEKAAEFADTLTEDQLVSLASGDPDKGQGGNLGAAGIAVPGSAGETSGCAEKQGLAGIVLADGPAGLRLMKNYHVYEGKIVNRPFEFSFEEEFFIREAGKNRAMHTISTVRLSLWEHLCGSAVANVVAWKGSDPRL